MNNISIPTCVGKTYMGVGRAQHVSFSIPTCVGKTVWFYF